jgi:uncharacterized protein YjbI with pentapeptide repeats
VLVTIAGGMTDPDAQRVILGECDFTKDELITISSRIYLGWNEIAATYDQLNHAYQEKLDRKEQQDKRRDANGNLPNGERELAAPLMPSSLNVDGIEQSWREVSDALVAKSPDLDFGNAHLFRCDFSTKDLSRMKMADGALTLCNVSGAHLAGAQLHDVNWAQTAWWLVADIDKKLLSELESRYPFAEHVRYVPDGQTQASYDANVTRLEAAAK